MNKPARDSRSEVVATVWNIAFAVLKAVRKNEISESPADFGSSQIATIAETLNRYGVSVREVEVEFVRLLEGGMITGENLHHDGIPLLRNCRLTVIGAQAAGLYPRNFGSLRSI